MAFVQSLKSFVERKCKFILIAMTTIILALTASNIFTFDYFWQWEIDHSTMEYNRRRLQIDGLEVRHADIVFAGDSFIEEGYWKFWFPEQDIINVGARGTTTYHMFWRRQHITRATPRKVFLMVGINDLNLSDLTLDTAELEKWYGDILDRMSAEAPDAQFYVHAILPTGAPWPRRFGLETLRPVNEFLAARARKHGYQFIDMTSDFSDSDGFLDSRFTDDGLHLNAEGYQLWVKRIRPYVEAPE